MLLVLLFYLLEALKWLVIIRALMSWFVDPGSDNPVVRLVRSITDPILRPMSEMLPSFGGVDLSPLLAFFALHLLQQLIIRLV